MKQFFVTGTDTDVGKTLVSAVLTKLLMANYWKPIQSGLADSHSDCAYVQQLTELPQEHFFSSTYALQASLSPHHAAELENVTIDLQQCQLPNSTSLIVEGAGGVYVPVNDQQCMLDLMVQLNLPVILVSRGGLGTINHTLLTIAALRQRNIMIHGIVFSGKLNPANQKTIEQWGHVRTLFHIPFWDEINAQVLNQWIDENHQLLLSGILDHAITTR